MGEASTRSLSSPYQHRLGDRAYLTSATVAHSASPAHVKKKVEDSNNKLVYWATLPAR